MRAADTSGLIFESQPRTGQSSHRSRQHGCQHLGSHHRVAQKGAFRRNDSFSPASPSSVGSPGPVRSPGADKQDQSCRICYLGTHIGARDDRALSRLPPTHAIHDAANPYGHRCQRQIDINPVEEHRWRGILADMAKETPAQSEVAGNRLLNVSSKDREKQGARRNEGLWRRRRGSAHIFGVTKSAISCSTGLTRRTIHSGSALLMSPSSMSRQSARSASAKAIMARTFFPLPGSPEVVTAFLSHEVGAPEILWWYRPDYCCRHSG